MIKNKKNSRVKKVFLHFVNVEYWTDWSRSKSSLLYVVEIFKNFFVIKKFSKTEQKEFTKVAQDLGLSDTDLARRYSYLRHLSFFMLLISLSILGYSTYHLMQGNFRASSLSFVIALIPAMLTFRYHYWAFIIENRNLATTVHDWFYKGFLGRQL
ncbi:MAG: type IVB secretion system protein IcmV [Legionellaceae bacterium]|nr:type IVB secretion system protein IcmV [Legionellaceae bacterium]